MLPKYIPHIPAGKAQLVLFDRSGAIDVKIDATVLEEKASFKKLGLYFTFKKDWGSYIISIDKTAFKKVGVLMHSMKFLSPEVALYLYKPTLQLGMEYCCHVWAGVHSCYLELLDKLHFGRYSSELAQLVPLPFS